MPRKAKANADAPVAPRANKTKPPFRIVDRLTGNPDYEYEAVIETDLPDGSSYRVGVLVTKEKATYRADKAAAELRSVGVEVDAQTLIDVAIG